MKKNSLSSKGLSLSQAQSISNLCNQRALEIGNKLSVVNNYSKVVHVNKEEHVTVKGRPIPENVVELLKEKSELHASQAFLMENLKAKDAMLLRAKSERPDVSSIKFPEEPKIEMGEVLPNVTEDWGWEQLTVGEYCEYLEAEAYASHIGQFIHEGKPLDVLRKELPAIPDIEWMTIEEGKKSPVKIEVHHTSKELLDIHEKLAAIHRGYEQRVNYFKAKVKNLTTEENARIAKVNADKQNELEKINNEREATYRAETSKANEAVKSLKAVFETTRQENIKAIASMRIEVDPRFQKVVDTFLSQLPETKE
jgi:hypothetical protein